MHDNNLDESHRWFEQAHYDLMAAKDSLKAGHFEWSCFQSQQSAEKSLKSVLYLDGRRSLWTHSVARLLKECEKIDPRFADLKEAKQLDRYYIQSRYPNGIPDQIPHEFFDEKDAAQCVKYAEAILSLAEQAVKR